jgi:hypothetical protein
MFISVVWILRMQISRSIRNSVFTATRSDGDNSVGTDTASTKAAVSTTKREVANISALGPARFLAAVHIVAG